MFGEPTSRTWTVRHQFFPTLHNDCGLLHTFAQGTSLKRAFLPCTTAIGKFLQPLSALWSRTVFSEAVSQN
jgi:hypothetical protein